MGTYYIGDGSPDHKLLLSSFSHQMFPDLDGVAVQITESEIIITNRRHGSWPISPDAILADGCGSMIFSYEGEIKITAHLPSGPRRYSLEETRLYLLPEIIDVELVSINRRETEAAAKDKSLPIPFYFFWMRNKDLHQVEISMLATDVKWVPLPEKDWDQTPRKSEIIYDIDFDFDES